jgi:phosphoribosylaminoimidazolecarboxamide formyltransferase/IMP cyclohydrolase
VATSIRRALLSVSDKTGIVDFARGLAALGAQILSTGGTAKALRAAGIPVTDVSEHTGSPEILDGRVKTLHPKIHGGILARRASADHRRQISEHDIGPIDLVCVNLYPFAEVTARGCSFDEAIENIDIGGPSMVRSAAKNHEDVIIVVDPSDYGRVLARLRDDGTVPPEERRELARKAYAATAAYDGMIADWLGRGDGPFGRTVHRQWQLVQGLRYGENPHQSAAFYRDPDPSGPSIATAKILQGKELSFNNIIDADAALQLVLEFDRPACVAIKHTNPCGAALADTPLAAFRKARLCDPVSIFGGIVAFNREVDGRTAEEMKDVFLEIVLAPAFSEAARAVYASSPKLRNVRLLEVEWTDSELRSGDLEIRKVLGGALVQTRDREPDERPERKVVTERAPTQSEARALDFAWRVAKHVKSNAIVLAQEDTLVGVGAGQMSRVDSARIAVLRAREHGREITGAAVASDAFFPFRDGLDVCAEAGATAVIQPGGSLRDAEVTAAANEHGMAMLHTGIRHFRH